MTEAAAADRDGVPVAGGAGAPAQAGLPLGGVRVLDLSRVLAGPFAGQMLADHGADVIKVEPPGGDETRAWGPPFLDNGDSAYFNGLNRNKRNICLDLKTDSGRGALARLLSRTDVVIENFRTGTMARWGLGYEDVLSIRHPRLVYCRISGYGASGPLGGLPGYDAALQAYGGLMSVNGEQNRAPMRVGVPIVDIVAAHLAVNGILLALRQADNDGCGQLVDVSLLDSVVSLLHPHSATWLATGRSPGRSGAAHPVVAPYQTFPTRTGDLFVAAANDRQFAALARVLGRPELPADARFADNRSRVAHLSELQAEICALTAPWDRDGLAAALLRADVPASPVNTVGEALGSAQVAHRDLLVGSDGYRGVGVPIKLSRTAPAAPIAPAGRGAHTDEILAELGYSPSESAVVRAAAEREALRG